MPELHETTKRLLQWAKRSLVAGDRVDAGLSVRDLLCGLAAMADQPEMPALVAEALELPADRASSLAFPQEVLADVDRAAAVEVTDRPFPLDESVQRVVDRTYAQSPDLPPNLLLRNLLATDHALVVALRQLNGAAPLPARASEAVSEPDAKPARAPVPTPTLDAVGFDLTRAAREGRLGPVVGREEIIALVAETLCRRIKRNPLLIGPAGVGKTAIAEALAQRIAAGRVPTAIRDTRIVQIRPSVLIARASSFQEFLEQVEAVVKEAGQPGIVLFIDEVHAMVGAGGVTGATDMASLMKPALARGDIACIAATTDYEYRKHISIDPALGRRFVPLRVQELTPEETLAVLDDLRQRALGESGVEVPRAVTEWIVDFAERHMRNRCFPDKAIDLLDQCVAHARMQESTAVSLHDAKAVARRLVGATAEAAPSLAQLRSDLATGGMIPAEDAEHIATRLDVTLQGLDVRPERPNAVVLLADGAAAWSQALARTTAGSVAGGVERVLTLDFAEYAHEADLTRLIGAAPGFVGYADTLPIHQLLQMPSCVLVCENVHLCHPRVREFLRGALASGVLRDGRGESIYLSDTIVLLTAQVGLTATRGSLGFAALSGAKGGAGTAGDAASSDAPATGAPSASTGSTGYLDVADPAVSDVLERVLGPTFVDEIDVVVHQAGVGAASGITDVSLDRWLARLDERYRPHGLDLRWDKTLLAWLSEHTKDMDGRDLERAIDNLVSRPIALILEERRAQGGGPARATLRVRHGAAGVEVEEEAGASVQDA